MSAFEKAIAGARDVFVEAFLAKVPSFVKISQENITMRLDDSGSLHFDVPKYVGNYRTSAAANAAIVEVMENITQEVLYARN